MAAFKGVGSGYDLSFSNRSGTSSFCKTVVKKTVQMACDLRGLGDGKCMRQTYSASRPHRLNLPRKALAEISIIQLNKNMQVKFAHENDAGSCMNLFRYIKSVAPNYSSLPQGNNAGALMNQRFFRQRVSAIHKPLKTIVDIQFRKHAIKIVRMNKFFAEPWELFGAKTLG